MFIPLVWRYRALDHYICVIAHNGWMIAGHSLLSWVASESHAKCASVDAPSTRECDGLYVHLVCGGFIHEIWGRKMIVIVNMMMTIGQGTLPCQPGGSHAAQDDEANHGGDQHGADQPHSDGPNLRTWVFARRGAFSGGVWKTLPRRASAWRCPSGANVTLKRCGTRKAKTGARCCGCCCCRCCRYLRRRWCCGCRYC